MQVNYNQKVCIDTARNWMIIYTELWSHSLFFVKFMLITGLAVAQEELWVIALSALFWSPATLVCMLKMSLGKYFQDG